MSMTAKFYDQCCGAAHCSGISSYYGNRNPTEHLKSIARQRMRITYYTFIDATTKDVWSKEQAPSQALKKYIEENKLGVVTETGWHLNQFHGPNDLNVFVWRVDKAGWDAWIKTNLKEDELAKPLANFHGVRPY